MARIAIFSLNYSPEPTGFAPHITALAEHLAANGHAVTVVTGFPFAPRWARWPEFRGQLFRSEIVNAVKLVRVSHFIPRRPGSVLQRLLMEGSFSISGLIAIAPRLLLGRKFDEIVYIGAQPAIAWLARIVAAFQRAPYIVEINDLAAQAAADVGILGSGWVQRMLERLEFAAYLPAAGATVLCRSFAEALTARGFPSGHIRLIRSPVDLHRVRPLPLRPEYRQRLGIPANAFVVLFAGSMGLKQGLTNVVEAAVRLRQRRADSRPVAWVLVGDGEMRGELGRLIREHQLDDTVLLLEFQPEEGLSRMFAAADVLLLNQLRSVKDTVIPSKLLTYMAAGRPVLAAVNPASQGAEILMESDGGLLVAPEDPDGLVEGVATLMRAGPQTLAAMSERNRAYAEQHFDQRTILAQHESFILQQLKQPPYGYASEPIA
jgi:colanic acid biosynthesis glycosyl transferase WcaI